MAAAEGAAGRLATRPQDLDRGIDAARGFYEHLTANVRNITFRTLHVFEFDDTSITREQIWLDTGAIVAQLTNREANNQ